MGLLNVSPSPPVKPYHRSSTAPCPCSISPRLMDATKQSVLDVIFEEDETTDYGNEDVEMVDADEISGCDGGGEAAEDGLGSKQVNENQTVGMKKKKKKKKKNKKRKRRNGESAPNITDINRFVIDTCRHLKEKKSYLVWNAVGCLGVSALSDLVREVDAIQNCGGQRTIDGKRFRTGGGILWNILKTRDPNAYKEIMKKGREFEKQLLLPKGKQKTDINEAEASQNKHAPGEAGKAINNSNCTETQLNPEPSNANKERASVNDRIRVPVSYEDLFEEGEIHE